jgi:hypothetical protein
MASVTVARRIEAPVDVVFDTVADRNNWPVRFPLNGYVHDPVPAVGVCAACQRALCRESVGRDTRRLICRSCLLSPRCPAIVDGRRCDAAALEFFRRWLGSLSVPPSCR